MRLYPPGLRPNNMPLHPPMAVRCGPVQDHGGRQSSAREDSHGDWNHFGQDAALFGQVRRWPRLQGNRAGERDRARHWAGRGCLSRTHRNSLSLCRRLTRSASGAPRTRYSRLHRLRAFPPKNGPQDSNRCAQDVRARYSEQEHDQRPQDDDRQVHDQPDQEINHSGK